jgi:hypothetical protein
LSLFAAVILGSFIFACLQKVPGTWEVPDTSLSQHKENPGKPNFPIDASLEVKTPIQPDKTIDLVLSVRNPLPSPVEASIGYRYIEGVEVLETDLNGKVTIPAEGTVQGGVRVKVPDENLYWITAEISLPNPSNVPTTLGVTAALGSQSAGKAADQGRIVTTKDGKNLSVILLENSGKREE